MGSYNYSSDSFSGRSGNQPGKMFDLWPNQVGSWSVLAWMKACDPRPLACFSSMTGPKNPLPPDVRAPRECKIGAASALWGRISGLL